MEDKAIDSNTGYNRDTKHIAMLAQKEEKGMKREMLQQKLAQKIEQKSVEVVQGTVGKSIPYMIHEVELPQELKKVNLDEL